ncbi:PaaX family transcriptional regulator [Cellulomonas xiejunii]|uniref:PadR family transcriptional regulator n=1 Tax=Cellulomonas xiejunii TaxID=2968083 RepID=A0ABY5KST1_9CELL|nr:PaaX family transcriptional regulator C-terminal domain-containing protein [Cellulomonas xiejunii]MCC2314862.1 PadR family transcriptional regulator [Cellulomonas xiejunii]MCC2322177.1 PadR family transcriptional regulator [Cellulomonas xiejunii]MCC2323180.1 PadR family transcriptional regulator [Cellulomonas xiejunii]UUI72231.1 PadR family transcriptional regulator [Cellulomonas xiejunii]
MSTPPGDAPGPEPAGVRRRPEQLLLAFMGELMVAGGTGPLPASVLIAVLGELGVGQAATRAALSRMAARHLLAPVRVGRTVSYGLTPESARVLEEARGRVFDDDPFAPHGSGWTLVSFSVPERRRDVRHRVRAQLAWAGFGLLRDGLWIAPGEVDVAQALGGVQDDGPDDGPLDDGELELLAFRAHEVPGFSAARSVRTAWRLEAMRARHEQFQDRWADRAPDVDHALRDVTALVADWLDLLRAVPRLPAEHLSPDWPAARSVGTFRRLHAALAGPAQADLARRLTA